MSNMADGFLEIWLAPLKWRLIVVRRAADGHEILSLVQTEGCQLKKEQLTVNKQLLFMSKKLAPADFF